MNCKTQNGLPVIIFTQNLLLTIIIQTGILKLGKIVMINVVLNIQDGEWVNYTVSVTADYKVFLSYFCEGNANVIFVSDQVTSTGNIL